MDLPTPILLTGEHEHLGARTRKAMEAEDIARTKWLQGKCPDCLDGTHTSPPGGSMLCQCGVLTCACINTPPRSMPPPPPESDLSRKLHEWWDHIGVSEGR